MLSCITFSFEITSTRLTVHCLKFLFKCCFSWSMLALYILWKVVRGYISFQDTFTKNTWCCFGSHQKIFDLLKLKKKHSLGVQHKLNSNDINEEISSHSDMENEIFLATGTFSLANLPEKRVRFDKKLIRDKTLYLIFRKIIMNIFDWSWS